MNRLVLALVLLLPGVAAAQSSTAPVTSGLEVHFLPLHEHGESILIKTPRGKRLLIDAGLPTAGPEVVEYLQEQGVRRLDALILSHDDPDHIGGFLDVLRCFPVAEWWDSPRPGTNALHRQVAALAKQRKVKRVELLAGGQRTLEPRLTVDVLGPSRPWLTSFGRAAANPNSLVLRLTYGKTRLLFTGDMYVSSEERLLERKADVACHLLKVAHHGSTTSSSLPFLRAAGARAAVICCDRSLGFPRPAVLKRLKQAKTDWYRTDRNGAVIVRTRGQGDLSFQVARGQKNDAARNRLRPFATAGKYAREALRAGRRLTGRVFRSLRLVGKPTKTTYHRADCDTLERKNAARWVPFPDAEAAADAGREPCRLCLRS